MHNHIGRPVRRGDFFGRAAETAHLQRSLAHNHVLLLAPRRVGKTSLMFRLAADREAAGRLWAYSSAAAARSEMALVLGLYHAAAERSLSVRARFFGGRLRVALGEGATIKGFGVDLTVSRLQVSAWRDVGDELVDALRCSDEDWLLLLDELPVFVSRLVHEPEGLPRARGLLEWLRAARQGPAVGPDRVRWLMAGSIGLDAVAQRLQLTATINDLQLSRLGAFTDEEGRGLLRALAQGEGLPWRAAAIERALQRVGWLIPYHLQLTFHQVRELGPAPPGGVDPARVDAAIAALEAPAASVYFDTWDQRLTEELGRPHDAEARALLLACAQDPDGATRAALAARLPGDLAPAERQERLSWLLRVLENDGYVSDREGRWRFRSPLLRAWWIRRAP
jgi:hypothetical protein